MKTKKKFDALGMKRALQAKLEERWANLTLDEIQAAIQRDLARSQSNLGKWWRKAEKAKKKGNRAM